MDLPGHGLSPPGITGFEAFCFKVFFVFDAHFDAQTYCDALKQLAMKCFYMRNAANDEECGYIDTEGNVCIPFIFDMNDDIDFINYFDKITSRAKITSVNKELSYFTKLVAGDAGDNILSVVKISDDTKGIGDTGAEKVYAMYKEKYSDNIDFDTDEFVENLCDILSIYKKNKEDDFKNKVTENIKFSRTLTRLDSKYLPDGYYKILLDKIKI